MSDQDPSVQNRSGGTDLRAGGDLNVSGGTIVGGNQVNQTTTNVGFGFKEVQRLLITVGVLVFITAACFFAGGIAIGLAAAQALDKPVVSSRPDAEALQQRIDQLSFAPSGTQFELSMTETELSSWVRFNAFQQLGFKPETGKVRLLGDNKVVVAGELEALGGAVVAANLTLQPGTEQVIKLDSVAMQVVKIEGSPVGWVPVPTTIFQPAVDQANATLATQLAIATTQQGIAENNEPALVLTGIKR